MGKIHPPQYFMKHYEVDDVKFTKDIAEDLEAKVCAITIIFII